MVPPVLSVSVRPPVSPTRDQLLDGVVKSPNRKLPIVRSAPSSVTVRSRVISTALKNAVEPAPSATVAPLQFAVSLQLPLASTDQVPSTARTGVASLHASKVATVVERITERREDGAKRI